MSRATMPNPLTAPLAASPAGFEPIGPGPAQPALGLNAARLTFFILSSTTPLAGVVGLLPLMFAFGSGAAVPITFIAITGFLLIFSVGYLSMSRQVVGAGSFYKLVSEGLGVAAGLGAAYVALLSYLCLYIATLAYIGFFTAAVLADAFGLHLPWLVWSVLAGVALAALARRQIELNSKILGLVVVVEILVILVLDLQILRTLGFGALAQVPIGWHDVASDRFGISLMFAVTCYTGFEAAALFSEESERPERSVAIATCATVVLIGLLFGGTAWLTVAAIGAASIEEHALAHVGDLYGLLTAKMIGPGAASVIGLMMVTSMFASGLACLNVSSRYVLTLARQRCLPPALGALHPRHRSPHVAGLAVSVAIGLLLAGLAALGLDPVTGIAASALGVGTLGIVSLLLLTSLSVVAFFWPKTPRDSARPWLRTVIAPAIGAVGAAVILLLAVWHFDLLTGSQNPLVRRLPLVLLPAFAGGVAYAFWLRRCRPSAYRSLADAI